MPSWLSEVLKLMGFTTPFVYAAAVYGLFHYLDQKASGPAKKAISGWLQPKEYDRTAVANSIIEIFDRIYTRPLFGWRAFKRSALFTLCMSAIFLYEFGRLSPEGKLIELLRVRRLDIDRSEFTLAPQCGLRLPCALHHKTLS
jgi:hypothetical protein